jgi:hypothetical protein
MRVKLTKDCDGVDGKLPAGLIIDGPKAHLLLELGVAEPDCDASREHAKLLETRRKNEDAKRRQKRQVAEEIEQRQRRAQFARDLGLAETDVEALLNPAAPEAAHAATDVSIQEPGSRSKRTKNAS